MATDSTFCCDFCFDFQAPNPHGWTHRVPLIQMDQKSSPDDQTSGSHPTVNQKSTKSQSKVNNRSSKSHPKVTPKSPKSHAHGPRIINFVRTKRNSRGAQQLSITPHPLTAHESTAAAGAHNNSALLPPLTTHESTAAAGVHNNSAFLTPLTTHESTTNMNMYVCMFRTDFKSYIQLIQ